MKFGKAAAVVLAAAVLGVTAAPVAALAPPQVIVGAIPTDDPPAPEIPMKQNEGCQTTGVLRDSDLTRTPPAELALELPKARALSRGAGVTVAVIDTGVTPHARLPYLVGGGDYLDPPANGLSDCDAHGTLVAGIIGAQPDVADGFTGVAPDARILSIRYSSEAFTTDKVSQEPYDAMAGKIRTLARAIVHAANQGAGVITVSIPICIPVGKQPDQTALATAIGYAVHIRGSLIVAGAGGTTTGCGENPDMDWTRPQDLRNWKYVQTISTPGWYAPDVLTVGYTTATGAPMTDSLRGPWVSVGAPGTGIESLGPGSSGLINGIGEPNKIVPVGGSSYAAAYVSGVAAMLRSRYPNETPGEISARLQASAHGPARGIDNLIGAGVIDPMVALSYRTAPKIPAGLFVSQTLAIPAPPRAKDTKPAIAATVVIFVAVLLGAGGIYASSVIRRRR